MDYIKLPHMDSPVSVFDVCQAHAQLESDYNVGGQLRERPSNQRRNESTSCQLHRMGYVDVFRWVEIVPTDEDGCEDSGDCDVRSIYLHNVLKLELPMDDEMRAYVGKRFVQSYLDMFPNWRTQ